MHTKIDIYVLRVKSTFAENKGVKRCQFVPNAYLHHVFYKHCQN